MLGGHLALVTAAAFSGAAIYINIAEQPARLALDPRSLLIEWKASYPWGFAMQASLALVSGLFGLLAFWLAGQVWLVVGALLILMNWPYPLLVTLPVNNRLQATLPDDANADTRRLIQVWDLLHMVRSVLGVAATATYLWALT